MNGRRSNVHNWHPSILLRCQRGTEPFPGNLQIFSHLLQWNASVRTLQSPGGHVVPGMHTRYLRKRRQVPTCKRSSSLCDVASNSSMSLRDAAFSAMALLRSSSFIEDKLERPALYF